MYRGTSVLTGDTLAGRCTLCQHSLVASHQLSLPCCWDSVQLLVLWETEEREVAAQSRKEVDSFGRLESL